MRKHLGLSVLMIFILMGCTQKKMNPTESPLPRPDYSALPTPLQSPLATATALPVVLVPPRINEPIYAGDTTVKGYGPAGLPIRLYDVGMTGNELGSVVVGEDGIFVVTLPEPLFAGQRVGLALGDLTGTTFTRQQLQDYAIIDLPVIGLLFTDIVVQSK